MFQQPKFLQGHISHSDIRDLLPHWRLWPPSTVNKALQIKTIYYFNVRCMVTPPLADIEYRSNDEDLDIRHHVFHLDRASYEFVFQHEFEVMRQANTKLTSIWSAMLTVAGGLALLALQLAGIPGVPESPVG
ncbi:hypothetical protein Tco_0741929 [Tanacetum coccineum]